VSRRVSRLRCEVPLLKEPLPSTQQHPPTHLCVFRLHATTLPSLAAETRHKSRSQPYPSSATPSPIDTHHSFPTDTPPSFIIPHHYTLITTVPIFSVYVESCHSFFISYLILTDSDTRAKNKPELTDIATCRFSASLSDCRLQPVPSFDLWVVHDPFARCFAEEPLQTVSTFQYLSADRVLTKTP
jgi:hypothetical protein